MSIQELRHLSESTTKSEFENTLREKIFAILMGSKLSDHSSVEDLRNWLAEKLGDLEYGKESRTIRSILLLFNLATLLANQQSNIRFQFDSFKKERWNIEHVRSVASDKPTKRSERIEWLQRCAGYLRSHETSNALTTEISNFLSDAEQKDEAFDELFAKLLAHFGEETDQDADHNVSNLTLLDEHTNKSYKNAVFAIKRQQVLSLDRAGIFVPLCTRNVFLKCYSPQVDNVMFWSAKDRNGYQEAIVDTLASFFFGLGQETV